MANPILLGGRTSNQSIYEELAVASTDQTQAVGEHPVGTRGAFDDGRVFYYTSNHSTALTAGSLLAVPVTTGLNRAATDDIIVVTDSFANIAVGVTEFVLQESDITTADLVANDYAEGYLYFNFGTGLGHTFKIRSHDGIDASGTSTAKVVRLYDPIVVAAVNTTEISFARNMQHRVIASTTAEEEACVGVAPIAVTASGAMATDVTATPIDITTYYFWAQTWGPCAVEVDDTAVASGEALTSGLTAKQVAGAVLETGATPPGFDRLQMAVGLVSAGAANDTLLVDLRIRP